MLRAVIWYKSETEPKYSDGLIADIVRDSRIGDLPVIPCPPPLRLLLIFFLSIDYIFLSLFLHLF